MNSITDKDYVDAKLEATVARFTGELKAHELILGARIDALTQSTDSGFKSLREEFEARFAKFETRLIKWVVATVLGGVVLNTSITTALLLNRTPPAPAAPVAPIIVYAQPAPQATR
ncbi:hypothetical protein FHW83_000093 [Duganella sp. SG902]|uniref:hypothetical protein n=1 Tax=Duganella sp. SG902 TaxID=2587016 RepID=UPI00159E3729|nr:hypothetical protein [Duganella sp. SG902]NVM74333.1 hypothetical protein [Duganella sp. SG902]